MNIECEVLEAQKSVNCSGVIYYEAEEPLTYLDKWFWIYVGIYSALVLLAGLMSGLTMGLLSLDLMSLKVLQDGGTPKQQRQARTILPVVSRHHLLLVTLLLANAVAVESMPLFLDRVSDPITAILVSVTAVLFFGEVVPQALCTRFGLAIGSTLVPLVYVLMVLLFPIAWPISKLLDCLLGAGHSTFYRRAELKALVTLHGADSDVTRPTIVTSQHDDVDGGSHDEKLTLDEVLIIKGALDLKDKTVSSAMVPIQSAFMMDVTSVLDEETMDKLLCVAHSRVPVYETSPANVRGVLLVKTLIKYSPQQATPFSELLSEPSCVRPALFVREDLPLIDMLNQFQTGKCHMAMVQRSRTDDQLIQHENLVGLITLEDVMEEILQEEIIDETDVFVDVHQRIRVAKARFARQLSRQSCGGHSSPQVDGAEYTDAPEDEPLLAVA